MRKSEPKYILSYVNTDGKSDKTVDYDRAFRTLARLTKFVKERHPDFSSYQIIVLA